MAKAPRDETATPVRIVRVAPGYVVVSIDEHVETPVLTDAERDVLQRVLRGESRAEMALARGATPATISNQLRSIYAKIGVRSRAELVKRLAQRDEP